MSPVGRLTETMIRVTSVPEAAARLERLLDLRTVEDGEGWRLLEDRASGQRVVLTDRDFGSPWALMVAAGDPEATAAACRDEGAAEEEGGGFRVHRLPEGPALFVYPEDGADG